MSFDSMIGDSQHWHSMLPPLSPDDKDIAIYKQAIGDLSPVYLLGMTKQLVELCDVAVDLFPIEIGKPTIQSNWLDLDVRAGAVIGDGVINLAGFDLIDHMLSISERFICRVFMAKQPGMKYATFFPTEFPHNPTIISTQKDIAILIWDA